MELDPKLYTVAWIAPLEIEARAAACMLDREHVGRFPMQRGDDYVYQAGEVCGHNVVIATLPAGQEYGTGSAAALASQVKKFFPNIWFGLLVGVAAGLPKLTGPSPRDIRLGDVLVALPEGDSAGLIAYDLGKETGSDGFQLLRGGHVLAVTETVVRAAIGRIKGQAPNDANRILPYYNKIKNEEHDGGGGTFVDPGQDTDRFYGTDEAGRPAIQRREPRPDERRTRIWYGPIGSGEKLMKNASMRNELRDRYNIIGLEMEAAGTMNRIPVGVIRGVCDYGDEHKNKEWQPYAAAMAAAYAKAVLAQVGPSRPTSVYCIPFRRNLNFTGRRAQLDQLERMLFHEKRERIAVVGLGGMGKTQIALELAHRVRSMQVEGVTEKHSVFWMLAESMATFHKTAGELAQRLNIQYGDDDPKKALRTYLESDAVGHWLLVVDNVDDATILDGLPCQSAGLSEFLPRSRKGRLLITTRLASVAVDAAGTYMNKKGTPIVRYLQLCRSADQNMIDLLSKRLRDETHHSEAQGAVATTWTVSFEAIRKTDMNAVRLLSFIRWIESKAIPISILPTPGSQIDLEDSIGLLCGYGFLSWREDGETLDMHSLVHVGLQLWLDKEVDDSLTTEDMAIKHLYTVFPSNEWENRPIWRQFLPHILPLMNDVRLRRGRTLQMLGHRAGLCLQMDGRTSETVNIFELLAAIRKETLAETDPGRLASERELAGAYQDNGQVKEAIKTLKNMVAIENRILASTHPDRLLSQYALASAYQADGQVKEAIKLLEPVVAFHKGALAKPHPHRLASQFALASAYQADGQGKKAIEMLEPVVAIHKETLAESHPTRLISHRELASAYQADGRVKEAIDMLEHVVDIPEETLAETHPERLASQHALAAAYLANGQVKKAIEILEHIAAIHRKTLAETHPSRLASYHLLACAYQGNSQVKEAINILEHVVAVHGKTLARTHLDRLASQQMLASAYQDDGQGKKAIEMLEPVVAIHKETLAESHLTRLISHHELASAYQANGRVKEAIDMLEHVVAIWNKTSAETHPDRLASQHELARAYQANGQVKEAIEMLEHVVAMREEALPKNHPDRLASQYVLIGAYLANGQVKEKY